MQFKHAYFIYILIEKFQLLKNLFILVEIYSNRELIIVYIHTIDKRI